MAHAVERLPVLPEEVSLVRLYTLRLAYAILAVGLGVVMWPTILHHDAPLALRSGIKLSMLGALGLTALLGLRYPVKMLPLLLFEFTWKAVYLLAFALPLWRGHNLTQAAIEDISSCATVVVLFPLIPWRYVFAQFATNPADRWR